MAEALATHQQALTLPGANRSAAKALDQLASGVHASTLDQGGVTIYPLTGTVEKVGDPGYIVGKYANQSGKTAIMPVEAFTPDTVRAYLEQHADTFAKDPELALGAWTEVDEKTGKTLAYLDVATKEPGQREASITGARQRQPKGVQRDPETGQWPMPQKAIFDLKAGKTLPIGNLAEFLASEEFQQRLDDMYAAGVPVMRGKEWWNLYGGPLERVYGEENIRPMAGFLASTSPSAGPVHNLRTASEYMRRWLKGEPLVQQGFRIPETAVGARKTSLGSVKPGDYSPPGRALPLEMSGGRIPNIERVGRDELEELQLDKVNDMFHALTGHDVGVYDRRYAKLAEAPERGIFVEREPNVLPGGMDTPSISPYAMMENAVRTAAKRNDMPLGVYSSYVWEGIGDTIKRTGELYGTKHPAGSIPESSQGFADIFTTMIAEKAKAWGLSVPEFEARLKRGDAELLGTILATPVGWAAYQQWQQAAPQTPTASAPPAT
jgi:hypothetical protein